MVTIGTGNETGDITLKQKQSFESDAVVRVLTRHIQEDFRQMADPLTVVGAILEGVATSQELTQDMLMLAQSQVPLLRSLYRAMVVEIEVLATRAWLVE